MSSPFLRCLAGSAASILAAPAFAQTTALVSYGSAGLADDGSIYPEISADGRWIAYQSTATNLVPGDTNAVPDVFLHDVVSGTTIRVSVDSNEQQSNDDCLEPALSADGLFVAHFAYATNLVPGDTNGKPDIFVRDVAAGTTTRVSVGAGGLQADGASRYPSISGDGRYVAFESTATNLVAGDSNGLRDLFVHDRATGTTVRASVDAAGQEGDGESVDASLSPDGRYVAFESTATNLVPGDTNGVADVFVKDLQTGAIFRASIDSAGVEGDGPSSDPSLSDQALFVCFTSDATNLVPFDGNGYLDIFVRDVALGTTDRADVATSGAAAHTGAYDGQISADGRYVTFFSFASNLVVGDTNLVTDIFVRDLVNQTTERVSIGSFRQQGDEFCSYPSITPGGRYVAFDSGSTNLVPGDTNGVRDAFVHDRLSPFRTFCPGDGTLATSCPCSNVGIEGHGCENSSTTGGATLVPSGATSPDTAVLHAAGERPTTLSIFLQGNSSSSSGLVYGDGVRCVTGSLKRLYVKNAVSGAVSAPASGDPSITARSAALGDTIPPGATRYYQVYYRDAAAFCPSATFNVTNGVRIGW